jgi:hypothetical protein
MQASAGHRFLNVWTSLHKGFEKGVEPWDRCADQKSPYEESSNAKGKIYGLTCVITRNINALIGHTSSNYTVAPSSCVLYGMGPDCRWFKLVNCILHQSLASFDCLGTPIYR